MESFCGPRHFKYSGDNGMALIWWLAMCQNGNFRVAKVHADAFFQG